MPARRKRSGDEGAVGYRTTSVLRATEIPPAFTARRAGVLTTLRGRVAVILTFATPFFSPIFWAAARERSIFLPRT